MRYVALRIPNIYDQMLLKMDEKQKAAVHGRQSCEQCLLHIHFIIVTTNRKELNAERRRSILTHLGGPQWVSEGREESGQRRKEPETHLSNVIYPVRLEMKRASRGFTTPISPSDVRTCQRNHSQLNLWRIQTCISTRVRGATLFLLSKLNVSVGSLCCSKYDVSPVTQLQREAVSHPVEGGRTVTARQQKYQPALPSQYYHNYSAQPGQMQKK